MRRRIGAAPVAWGTSLAIAVVVLGPALLFPGTVLRGDMVFVPHQPWKDAWLGLDGSVPRAVPMDALVSAATQLVPGGWVQKGVLLASYVVGGVGIGRLVQHTVGTSPAAVAAACTVFLWNPWVVERLSIGQWATVAGYALLPWTVLAGQRLRETAHAWPGLFVTLALSSICSPSSGITAAGVATVMVLARRPAPRVVLTLVGCAVTANLPWALPALTLGERVDLADRAGIEAFHAVGESTLGLLPSVVGLGGIWKASVVPAERTSVLVVGVSAALSVLALVALARSAASGRHRVHRPLLVIGAVSVVVCVVPAWDPGVMSTLTGHVPGLAMLRDSHRFLAPLALLVATGTAIVVDHLVRRAGPSAAGARILAASLAVAPVLLLPSATWGLAGDLRPVSFPPEWEVVADELEAAGPSGAVVVLPWEGGYRRFAWNRGAASLDPAPRALPGEVLVDDRLVVDETVVPGEDPVTAAVTAALDATDPERMLSSIGVRWVLVEDPLPDSYDVPGGRVVHDGPGLRLVDLGPPTGSLPSRGETWRGAILAADLAVLVVLLGATSVSIVHRATGRYAAART